MSILFIFNSAQADDLVENQERLQEIQQTLKALQSELAEKEKEASDQRQALKDVERRLGQAQRETRELAARITQNEAKLQQLNGKEQQLTTLLDEKAEDIKAILRLAYKQNNQPMIKLLLSGERPEDLSRHLYYFSVLTRNQQVQVDTWLLEQAQLSKVIAEQTTLIAQLETEREALSAEENNLARQKNRRAQVVANIDAEVKSTSAEIQRQELEREKTQAFIAELEAQLEAMNLDFSGAVPAQSVKGQMPWPVNGKLTNQYGRTIDNSRLTWEGWLIAAADGEPVQAVHGGRIIFADFFKSHGLLVIVDHGDGIWTLYGRNQTLLRDVGSWVEPGDVIAEVGRSGGYSASGLYFEVRRNGEPQNPASWLRKR